MMGIISNDRALVRRTCNFRIKPPHNWFTKGNDDFLIPVSRDMASAKQNVLSLYRRIFRLAKSWQAMSGCVAETNAERKYIISEARHLFRKNKEITNGSEINEFIREAEARIELALHYRNPYPRPMNIPQSTLPYTGLALKKSQKLAMKQSKPIYLKSYDDVDR